MSPWMQTCSYKHIMHMYTMVTMYISTIVRETVKTIIADTHHLSRPGPYQAQMCLHLQIQTYWWYVLCIIQWVPLCDLGYHKQYSLISVTVFTRPCAIKMWHCCYCCINYIFAYKSTYIVQTELELSDSTTIIITINHN